MRCSDHFILELKKKDSVKGLGSPCCASNQSSKMLFFHNFQGCLEAEGRSHRSYYSRMKRYLYDFWNLVDLLSYALLLSALFVRHFYIDETFTIARRMFALSLLVMYLRFLEVFLIHRTLGPTLIMIKEMVCGFQFLKLNFMRI